MLQVLESLFGKFCLSRNANPSTSYLYEAMERVKESLERLSDGNDANMCRYGSFTVASELQLL